MKKNIVKALALLLLLGALLSLFAACGRGALHGTYTALGITLTFDGDRFEVSKGESSSGSGTYKIEENEETGTRIYFTFEEGKGTYQSDFSSILIAENGVAFEKKDGYIRIAGIPFSEKK